MLSQRGKPLLVHDGHTFGIQYIRKDKKYWQCNLSRKFNCKARVTTTENGEIIVTNNEHCHTEIRQHLRKDYKQMQQNAAASSSALALPAGEAASRLNDAITLASKNAISAFMSHAQPHLLPFAPPSLQPPVAHQNHSTWSSLKDELV